jgi:micrococcal nuclease
MDAPRPPRSHRHPRRRRHRRHPGRWGALVWPIIAAALALAVLASLVVEAAEPGWTGRVVRLIDGDTIWVDTGGRVEKVRYIGIDAPEVRHPTRGEEPGGRAATDANRRLVAGRQVRLEPDVQVRDRYGRLLAYVWVRGDDGRERMVNAELVRSGHAQVATFPPNVRHAETFRRLQREARAAGRGLWGR